MPPRPAPRRWWASEAAASGSAWRRGHGGVLVLLRHGLAQAYTLLFLAVFTPLENSVLVQAAGSSKEDRPYAHRSYLEIMSYFRALESAHPDIVQTWTAQEIFPDMLPSKSKETLGICQGEPCKTMVVRIANKRTLTNTTPEVFFSGALHGDERVGPATVTELAGFLCKYYTLGMEDVRRLVDTRSIWITPVTNAVGFAQSQRLERGMDPNRDFPYLQSPSMCMRTQTGRVVNELFRRHLFQFMITFHGGMRALTYEWGSKNHLQQPRKSTESPDNAAFKKVGQDMQKASGQNVHGSPWYPLGPINDLVYPVDGGMEDWSYAAGWEASPRPISVCRPTTYGGYKSARTQYKQGTIGALVYLAEASNRKNPPSASLGRPSEIWVKQNRLQGHVPRNMRMCLRLIELARPELELRVPGPKVAAWSEPAAPGQELEVEVQGHGCQTFHSPRLLLIPRALVSDCVALGPTRHGQGGDGWGLEERRKMLSRAVTLAKATEASTQCRGVFVWAAAEAAPRLTLRGSIPSAIASGDYCAVVAAEFDEPWASQSHPDPSGTAPRAHATRLRLEEHYTASANDKEVVGSLQGQLMQINEFRTKVFAVRSLTVASRAGAPTSASATTATVLPSSTAVPPPASTSLPSPSPLLPPATAEQAATAAGWKQAANKAGGAGALIGGRPSLVLAPAVVFAVAMTCFLVLVLCGGWLLRWLHKWHRAGSPSVAARPTPRRIGAADMEEASETELQPLENEHD